MKVRDLVLRTVLNDYAFRKRKHLLIKKGRSVGFSTAMNPNHILKVNFNIYNPYP